MKGTKCPIIGARLLQINILLDYIYNIKLIFYLLNGRVNHNIYAKGSKNTASLEYPYYNENLLVLQEPFFSLYITPFLTISDKK